MRDNGIHPMRTVFLLHAVQDETVAGELAQFLREGANVQVFLEEGRLAPGQSLVAKAPEGLMADALLVIVSGASVPPQWRRDEWEPALWSGPQEAGVATALLQVGPCRVPDLLRRRNYFELQAEPLTAFRKVKSWLLASSACEREPAFVPAWAPWFDLREAELEELRRGLGDRPGRAAVTGPAGSGKTVLALQFAAWAGEDFEAVFWACCQGRSLAGLVCDLAEQAGLPAQGPLENELKRLQGFCAAHRFLLILDGLEREEQWRCLSGGWSSTLVTTRLERLPAGVTTLTLSKTFPPCCVELSEESAGRLLSALAASAPCTTLEWAAGLAELSQSALREVAGMLKTAKWLLTVNERTGAVMAPTGLRERFLDRTWRDKHARQASRSAAASWAELERAMHWALDRQDAPLAAALARRAAARARHDGRLAEAQPLLEAAHRLCSAAGRHQQVGDLARELFWICSDWDLEEEARKYRWYSEMAGGTQLSLPF